MAGQKTNRLFALLFIALGIAILGITLYFFKKTVANGGFVSPANQLDIKGGGLSPTSKRGLSPVKGSELAPNKRGLSPTSADEEEPQEEEEELSEDERREREEEALVDKFDGLTDKWMEVSEKSVTMADVEAFSQQFAKVPKARKEECLHRALNLIPDENVMLLAGVLMDKEQSSETIDAVFSDILNRDESVKLPVLREVIKDTKHQCWKDAAWILDVTRQAPVGGDAAESNGENAADSDGGNAADSDAVDKE